MKISLDWISDFVDLSGIEPETIADRLTLCTAEVDSVGILSRAVDGVVVGEVLSAEPIAAEAGPTDGPLRLATVDCGKNRYQTVCTAPNLRVGMKTPFAPAGVTLAGEQQIRGCNVAGCKSEGVLCSAKELGMSRWHEGVLDCPESLDNGAPLGRFIPARDVIIEIDNKSLTHRPDLWGHYGVARELAAIFERNLRPLPVVNLARYDGLRAYPLEVEDTDGCPCYGCLEFRVAAAVPSPLVIQRRLHALDQRTYNLLVDLTNYAMLELGQPTHAFDGDRLKAIRVARMGREGTFVTLDGQQRSMLPDDLLIWNEKEPVALAGVMGGLNSEVQQKTTRVLLESANFKASRIRRTSVRLDLRTESAQRFEKNQPPVNVKLGVARILQLVEDAGVDHQVTSRFTVAGDLKEQFRPLELAPGGLRTMAGAEIPQDSVVSILQSLGFQARHDKHGRLHVGVPPHRSEADISIPADIAEEVLRIYGYDKIQPCMPAAPMKPLFVDKSLRTEHKARRLLASAHRFIEVHNYCWTDDRWLSQIGFEPQRALALKNPSTQHTRLLRTTLLPNLLALVLRNRAHRDNFRLFEVGHVYHLAADGGCVETNNLAALSFNESNQPSLEEHFRRIKGVVEDLAGVIGERFTFMPSQESRAPWQVPKGHLAILRNQPTMLRTVPVGTNVPLVPRRPVGALGVLSGPIMESVSPEAAQVVWFELAMDQLEGPLYAEVKYVPPPIYPGSWQDFSLVWDVDRGFAALEERLATFSHPLIMRRDFLYAYKGKGLPSGKASYSYRYWLGAWDRTLSSEDIDQFRNAFLVFLESEGIPLR